MADMSPWRSPDEDLPAPGPRRTAIASVGVWSAMRVAGSIYAGFGVLGGVMIFAMQAGSPSAAGFGMGFAVMAPFLYGAMGALGGALMAFAYNLSAAAFGGIELELE
jgi:hypothetical protein